LIADWVTSCGKRCDFKKGRHYSRYGLQPRESNYFTTHEEPFDTEDLGVTGELTQPNGEHPRHTLLSIEAVLAAGK